VQNSIKLSRQDLEWALEADFIDPEQVDPLWTALNQHYNNPLSAALIGYYIGAALSLIGIGFFLDAAWHDTKGFALSCILFGFTLFFCTVGALLRHHAHLKVGGILLTLIGLFLVPILVESFFYEPMVADFIAQAPLYNVIRLMMPALVTTMVATYYWKSTKIAAFCLPVYISAWLWIAQVTVVFTNTLHIFDILTPVSLAYGTFLLMIGLFNDVADKMDEAFWAYLIGAIALWCGAAMMDGWYEWDNPTFLGINLGFMVATLLLKRMVFLFLGGTGLTLYVSYLAYVNYSDSVIFPIVLVLVGLLIIGLTSFYKYHQASIESFIYKLLPEGVHALLPRH